MTTCPKCGAESTASKTHWTCGTFISSAGKTLQGYVCLERNIERLEAELAAARAEVERLTNAPLTADSIDKMSRDCWRKVAERLEKENWIFKTAMQYERDHDDGTERGL